MLIVNLLTISIQGGISVSTNKQLAIGFLLLCLSGPFALLARGPKEFNRNVIAKNSYQHAN